MKANRTAIAVALMLALAAWSRAAEITVEWEFPTTNEDGSALTDLAGARLHYGTTSSNYTATVDVPGGQPGETRRHTITGLPKGQLYYVNATAYNADGAESDFVPQEVEAKARTKPGKMTKLIRIGK